MQVLVSLFTYHPLCRLALLVSATLLTGCSRSGVPAAVVSAASVRATASSPSGRLSPEQAAIAHVQTLPLYQQAQAACKEQRYGQAATLLQQLTALSSLTAAERAFVLQQRALCLKDAGLPVLASSISPSGAAPAPALSTAAPSLTNADCGPRALLLLCHQLGVKTTLPFLRQKAGTTKTGTSLAGLATAAQAVGLKAEGVQVSREALPEVETPALAYVNGNHFIAVLALSGKGKNATARVQDPNAAGEATISQERLLRLCSGYLLLLHP